MAPSDVESLHQEQDQIEAKCCAQKRKHQLYARVNFYLENYLNYKLILLTLTHIHIFPLEFSY